MPRMAQTTTHHTQTILRKRTLVQQAEINAQALGFIVKRGAVVMQGLKPIGILVKRLGDKEYSTFLLQGDSHEAT